MCKIYSVSTAESLQTRTEHKFQKAFCPFPSDGQALCIAWLTVFVLLFHWTWSNLDKHFLNLFGLEPRPVGPFSDL